MKNFSTNYYDCFIKIAEDCPADKGEIPPAKTAEKTIASIQYDMLVSNPYKYTSDEVLFQCYVTKNKIQKKDLTKQKEQFFLKGQACLRALPLAKRYGWGIHYNNEGRIAIYGCETKEYNAFSNDKLIKKLKGIRSNR
jgi:hypothetical protein